MPIVTRILSAERLVESKASGEVTFADLLAMQNALRDDPLFHPDFDQVLDFSGAQAVMLTAEQLRLLALATCFGRGARRAFVVDPGYALGLARTFQELCADSGARFANFATADEARAWLGRAPASSATASGASAGADTPP